MSWSIFLTCFRDGKGSQLPESVVEDAFGKFVNSRDSNSLSLAFPDGGVAKINFGARKDPTGFAINRPPVSPEFWSGLLKILETTTSALYWPGEGWAIARTDTISNLPRDWVDAHGLPTMVATVAEILELIRRA